MSARKILTLIFSAFVLAEARWHVQKRDVTSICNASYNSPSKILCYCVKDIQQPEIIKSADCYLTVPGVKPNDHSTWDLLGTLKSTAKLVFTNTRQIPLQYVPTHALKHLDGLLDIDIKYGNIEKVHAYAFANLSLVEEIGLTDSQIKILEKHAFAHHRSLAEIKLDKNNIIEINRDVFVDLPALEKLFLTGNQITTLHDRAFLHLNNLKELEININKLFSLNSETFAGLRRLLKLDLSSNNLEVIGDNTFLPLVSLEYLNLEGNKIQMLDEKAFHGLKKLKYLSLAHNKLAVIENANTFVGLKALKSLSLRANEIKELKFNVMAPLEMNFYDVDGHLDVEDNQFPCDCRLDWFLNIMNKTQSKNLKIALENIKCIPDTRLRERWNTLEENEKSSGQLLDVEETPTGAEYEYYDETQLNGKLFYTDVKDLIDCGENNFYKHKELTLNNPTPKPVKFTKDPGPVQISFRVTNPPESTMATIPGTRPSTPSSTPVMFHPQTIDQKPMASNHGLLDLSLDETTSKLDDTYENEIINQKKPEVFTTNHLATVSAKPYEKNNVYENMAADEAKPDKLKSQRSLHDEPAKEYPNRSQQNTGCVALVFLLSLRLFH